MLDELSLPTLGLGGAFIVAAIVAGSLLGGNTPNRAVEPAGRIKAADLDVKSSDILIDEQLRVGKVCTKAMIRSNEATRRQSPLYLVASDDDVPDYCQCLVGRASGEISRFQLLVMEELFRISAEEKPNMLLGSSAGKKSSPEFNTLGREAMKLGLSHADVQARIDAVDTITNRIARYCASFVPKPTRSTWQSKRDRS